MSAILGEPWGFLGNVQPSACRDHSGTPGWEPGILGEQVYFLPVVCCCFRLLPAYFLRRVYCAVFIGVGLRCVVVPACMMAPAGTCVTA